MKRLFFIVLSFITLNTSLSARSWADIDVTRDEYYVTVKGTTDGDGSSWDMAISSDEFSYVLPNAKKGAIFHLAAGEYNPILDSTLNVPSNGQDPYRTFLIRKPVTICTLITYYLSTLSFYQLWRNPAKQQLLSLDMNYSLLMVLLPG